MSMKSGKAPGIDRVEVEALKAALGPLQAQLRQILNNCLRLGIFPKIWKIGSIRALLKGPDKDESLAKSYRPICLLPVLGKAFEKLLIQRLQPVIRDSDFTSDRQFGFVKGRSTEDAIIKVREITDGFHGAYYVLAILFDIAGAFDHVWWPSILHRLKERQCPRNVYEVVADYLRNREVRLVGKHGEVQKQVTRGCPQGSIMGPTFWNLVFDDSP